VIRVILPAHLRTLARVEGEVHVDVRGAPTAGTVIDAIEARYPMLRGTIRDHITRKRRAYIRYYLCGEDISHEPDDAPLPDVVTSGQEPFRVLGAMSGG
jgi:hypothetical protein